MLHRYTKSIYKEQWAQLSENNSMDRQFDIATKNNDIHVYLVSLHADVFV